MLKSIALLAALATVVTTISLLDAAEPSGGANDAPATAVPLEGIRNAFKLTERVYSGGRPRDEAGFASLEKAGIKLIVAVDPLTPNVEMAKRHGIRYVQVPVGMDGIERDEALTIARAVRDLPGPAFIQDNAGNARSLAAAALVAVCDAGWTGEKALAFLKQAGIRPRLKMLHESVKEFAAPTKAEIDKADNTFPAVAKLEPVVASMLRIDRAWDDLRDAVNKPKEHPNIDPKQEAVKLRDALHEFIKMPGTVAAKEDFRKWADAADGAATALEAAVREGKTDAATQAIKTLNQNCNDCHNVYREGPG